MSLDADLAQLATAAVCELDPYQPGKPPEELEREYGVSNAIKLASNENPRGPAPNVQKAIKQVVEVSNRYPDGAGFNLRNALAEHLAVEPEQITLGNGSNDILVLLAECFLNAANSAIYDQYSFVVYRLVVQATGAEARISKSLPREHPQFLGHDLGAMLRLIDATTRLIYIANPNNPTGTWVETSELQHFLTQVPEHVIVVLDEAYHEYAWQSIQSESIQWLAKHPNLVVVRTFSKAYGLAGLRVGYAISHAKIADLMNRIRQPFNVNHIALTAAECALNNEEWLAESCKLNDKGMALLTDGLRKLGVSFIPSRANFVLMEVENSAECYEYLLHHGVIVRPVANYGLESYLRVSVGTLDEVEIFLSKFSNYLDESVA